MPRTSRSGCTQSLQDRGLRSHSRRRIHKRFARTFLLKSEVGGSRVDHEHRILPKSRSKRLEHPFQHQDQRHHGSTERSVLKKSSLKLCISHARNSQFDFVSMPQLREPLAALGHKVQCCTLNVCCDIARDGGVTPQATENHGHG